MKRNWKTALMTSVAIAGLMGGFWGHNSKTEQQLDNSTLIEGIVNIPETETQEERNTIVDALMYTAETQTGRKILEQMYGHYGTNDETRVDMVIDDLKLTTTGHCSKDHKIALNGAYYLPDGVLKYCGGEDIRVTTAHEMLHELQNRERGTEVVGHTYEDDFKEDKLQELEAKVQNIVIENEIHSNISSLTPLYNYLINKLNGQFSFKESESMAKTALFNCLMRNDKVENAIASCLGNSTSLAELNKSGINLKECNEEINEWNTFYNKQAIRNAYSNQPLRIDLPGISPQATEEQQKNIYQSYITRLNKNGIAVSMEDIQKGFNVRYQDDPNLFFEGNLTIIDSLGEHTFKTSENPIEIADHKEVGHGPNTSGLLGRLSKASEKGKSVAQKDTSKGIFSVGQQAALNAKKLQY